MDFQGFDAKDFCYFLDNDKAEKVDYIKGELHPRLREFGWELRDELKKALGIELRSQLRSGRWFKNPWGSWVSLIYPDEPQRSDNRRPRLSVFLDEDECIVGYQQNIWRPRWQRLVSRHRKALASRMTSVASGETGLEFILSHWVDQQRRTTVFDSAGELLDAAAEWGQDFVAVGRRYPFPQEAEFLTSPALGEEALAVLKQAFPLYRFAFEKSAG